MLKAKCPMAPFGYKVVIQLLSEKAGAIALADIAQERPTFGIVLAAGYDCKFVQRDQVVMFGKYAGTEITISGVKLLVVHEEEISGALGADVAPELVEMPEAW